MRTMGGRGQISWLQEPKFSRDARAGWLLFNASKQVRRKVKLIPISIQTTKWQPGPPAPLPHSGYGVRLLGLPDGLRASP